MMGNHGSSRSCADIDSDYLENIYGRYPYPGKITVRANPDIAGIGILVSFYFSAFAVFAVVIAGYLNGCLPSNLLRPIDRNAVRWMKRPFRRARRHPRPQIPSKGPTRQRRRTEVLVAFVKILSDQQLITGLAILIALLSNPSKTTHYEMHIVASLAYFLATSHALSLEILRAYLREHFWVRVCRIIFTMSFLTIFSSVFLVDRLYSWTWKYRGNPAVTIECVLHDLSTYEYTNVDSFFILVMILPVLMLLWGKHMSAIIRICSMSDSKANHGRHTTAMLLNHIHLRLQSWTAGLSVSECRETLEESISCYDEKLRPSENKEKLSILYFLEQYHETYLSEVPIWTFQIVYGTTKTRKAVWSSSHRVDPSQELNEMGFGQVVAIGLLVLPLLNLIQIMSEHNIFGVSLMPSSHSIRPQPSTPRAAPEEPSIESYSCAASASNQQILSYDRNHGVPAEDRVCPSAAPRTDTSIDASDDFNHNILKKLTKYSLILCVLSTATMSVAGVISQSYLFTALLFLWLIIKLTITIARQVGQIRYMRKRVKDHKEKGILHKHASVSSSDSSTTDLNQPSPLPTDRVLDTIPPLSPIDASTLENDSDNEEQVRLTARDVSPIIDLIRRQDTEADLGLTSLHSRSSTVS